jgi:hypothetical protein
MPLNKAQLMDVPGGPGVTGSVKGSATVAVSADGTLSTSAKSLLPTYVAGRFLYTDGTNLSWQEAGGGGGGGSINSIIGGTNIRVTAGSGPITTVATVDNPSFAGVITGAAGMTLTGGTYRTQSTGTAASPAFDVENSTGSFSGGMWGNAPDTTLRFGVQGNTKFQIGENLNTSKVGLLVDSGGFISTPGGSATDPGFTLQNPTGTFKGGLFLDTSNSAIGMSVQGTSVLKISTTKCDIAKNLVVNGGGLSVTPGGSAATPGIEISTPDGTTKGGLYLQAANGSIGLSVRGVQVFEASTSQTTVKRNLQLDSGQLEVINQGGGSASNPAIVIRSPNSPGTNYGGVYINPSTNVLGLSWNGQTILEANSTICTFSDDVTMDGKVTFAGGTNTSPGLRFKSDLDTGVFQVGSGDNSQVGISCNGTEAAIFRKTEFFLPPTVGIDAVQVFNNPLASNSKVVVNSSGQFGINTTALPNISGSGVNPYGLAEILQLQTNSFYQISSGLPASEPTVGFVADYVDSVMPLAVGDDEFGNPYTVDTDVIAAALVSAVQELSQQLDDLRTEFDAYVATHP